MRVAGGGHDGRTTWIGVASLSLGIFSIAMSQFLPASLLSLMADDLRITSGVAGQSFAVTAVAAAASALITPGVLQGVDRRNVMIGLTLLAAVSTILIAVAPTVAVLFAARFLLGLALGGFWAMAISVTSQLVPGAQLGRALALVNAGVPIATGAAVPVGAWLGEAWGWRLVFALAAGAAVAALVMQIATLPRIPSGPAGGIGALLTTLRSRTVLLGLLATTLIYVGHFAGFVYIRPLAEGGSGIDPAGFGALLLAFGLANLAGTILAGAMADHAPRFGVLLFPGALGIGMLLMYALAGSLPGLFGAVLMWGFGFGGVATSLQGWGARTEPARLEQIGGLLVTVANGAVALGAVIGGILIDSAPSSSLPLLGGIAAIAGGAVIASLRTRL